MKKDTRRLRREQGLCARCGNPSQSYRCDACKTKRNTNTRKLYQERKNTSCCPTCGDLVAGGKVSCDLCLEKKREEVANRKKLVINYYGGKCECCSETCLTFLNIDHIMGGGNKHRAEIANFKGEKPHCNSKVYNWIVRNGFPDGFRVLCFNCNWSVFLCNGICAHKDPDALHLTDLSAENVRNVPDYQIPTPFFQRQNHSASS